MKPIVAGFVLTFAMIHLQSNALAQSFPISPISGDAIPVSPGELALSPEIKASVFKMWRFNGSFALHLKRRNETARLKEEHEVKLNAKFASKAVHLQDARVIAVLPNATHYEVSVADRLSVARNGRGSTEWITVETDIVHPAEAESDWDWEARIRIYLEARSAKPRNEAKTQLERDLERYSALAKRLHDRENVTIEGEVDSIRVSEVLTVKLIKAREIVRP